MVSNALQGAHSRLEPELVKDCSGGTYMIKNSANECVGIFKPVDEEPYAPENPKGLSGDMHSNSQLKTGIRVGEAAIRECASFLLDYKSFSGVPETVMMRIFSAQLGETAIQIELKTGSFQKFVNNCNTAEDISPFNFPVIEVQKIAILDIRIFNTDRHVGNILVKNDDQKNCKLIPIDHGFALPDWRNLDEVNHEWLFWPQAKKPLEKKCLELISSLDAERDEMMLRAVLPSLPEECILTMYLGTALLKHCILHRNMTVFEVGELFLRDPLTKKSPLEVIISKTLMRFEETTSVMDFYSIQDYITANTTTTANNSNYSIFSRMFCETVDHYFGIVADSVN
jgi:hypothetical protein